MSYQWIRASEISEFAYCHRAWWLKRVRGIQPRSTQRLNEGRQFHHHHGKKVRQVSWLRGAAYVFFFFAIAVLVFQMLTG